LLYSKLKYKLHQDKIHKIIKEAVDIETKFITESLPCNLIGMNCILMIQYIKFVADRLVKQLNYEPIYKVSNPFQFMDTIGMESKSNFFENRVSQYQKANIISGTSEFKLMDDF
jgi:ribonucleotide reductase beta subunit family protein with ferritin-like domain